MAGSIGVAPAPSGTGGRRITYGIFLSWSIILASSFAGAALFPLSQFGRTTPTTASKDWLLLLFGCSSLLIVWALIFAGVLRRRMHLSWERIFYWSAVCHLPLLLSLVPISAVYHSDAANNVFIASSYGQTVLQPLSKTCVIALPALAQLLRLLIRGRSGLIDAVVVAALFTGSLLLRIWGLDWGLPGRFHPDEYSGKALSMLATHDMNPHFFKNPSVMIYSIYSLQSLTSQHYSQVLTTLGILGIAPQDPRGDVLYLLAGRVVAAVAGALTVWVLYMTGKELSGRRVGFVAGVLLGVAFLHVRNSHYATNDVLATFFLTVSLLFSVRVYAKGRLADYLLAAAFGGLATSTKYTSVLFVLALLAAHLLRREGQTKRGPVVHLRVLLASGLVSLLAFFIGTPYAVLDFNSFLTDFRYQLALGAEYARGQEDSPTIILVMKTLLEGLGLVPFLLALSSVVFMARRDWRRLVLVICIPVVFVASISGQRYYYARFIIPVLPFLCLMSAWGVSEVGNSLGRGRWNKALLPLLLTLSVAQPLAFSVQHDLLLGRPDTRELAAHWIETDAPEDATIAVETHSLMDNPWGWAPAPGEDRQLYWRRDIRVFWPEKEEEMNEVLSGRFDYVIVTSWGYDTTEVPGAPPSGLPSRYEALDRAGTLVARFGPGQAGGHVPDTADDTYTPFWHLFDRERPGPTVKIYQMHP